MTAKINPKIIVGRLFEKWNGNVAEKLIQLPPSGSERIYYRIYYKKKSYIGAFNPNHSENIAFIEFTRHFSGHGMPVPKLPVINDPPSAYLVTDLGDVNLFSLLPQKLQQEDFSQNIVDLYKKAIEWLILFQTKAGKDLNYNVCYPRKVFDGQSMHWDLNYFKYFFLRLGEISFNEQKLEDDFEILVNRLSEAPSDYFMYRDFQSRNIMIVDNKPWFIDYQGGRKGPLQYDLASLLFDAKANMPFNLRIELLDYYIKKINNVINIDYTDFKKYFYGFALIRILQALGAYGFRGFFEKKPLFLQSIPYAQNNLSWILENDLFPDNLPNLKNIIKRIIDEEQFEKFKQTDIQVSGLKIIIRSFSYKKGIPFDLSGNGGGYTFDCRSLPNPGRLEEFKSQTGKEKPVIQYLEKEPQVTEFISKTSELVKMSSAKYIERGFTNLMVCYGCTGGQHRSVYCAEKLAEILKKEFHDISIDLKHEEENQWTV